ncbi:MAG: hypothetical protein DRP85_07515 [Candidatus Makaraimicrobium thalassicum]|nr:MAG: hypothetical protein DRP85_07515 [Candidatus Omnitrophota bacterium]
MKILIQIEDTRHEYLFLEISGAETEKSIETLINDGNYYEAKNAALSKGIPLGVFGQREIEQVKVDLIISTDSLHRDLTVSRS